VALTMLQYQKKGESSADATIVYPDAYKTGDAVWTNQ
jgi:hypothetical protein